MDIVRDIALNIGMSWENTVVFVLTIGCLIFCAKDFKIGIMMAFFINAGLFVLFYYNNFSWGISLVVTLVSLVVMALTLLLVGKTTEGRSIT